MSSENKKTWKCGVCSTSNNPGIEVCSKCFTPRAYKNFKVVKNQAICAECKHKHWDDMPCHVFIPKPKGKGGAGDEDNEDTEDEDFNLEDYDEDESDDEGGETLLGKLNFTKNRLAATASKTTKNLQMKAKKGYRAAQRKAGKRAALFKTPQWAKNASCKRCNCEIGVSYENEEEKMAALDRILRTPRGKNSVTLRFEDGEPNEQKMLKFFDPPLDLLQQACEFLDPRSIGHMARVKPSWNSLANEQPHYYDMHYLEVERRFDAFAGKVDSVYVRKGIIFLCGNKQIQAWSDETMRMKKVIMKDSATISRMVQGEGSLLSLSANGSIRELAMQHDVMKTAYKRTLWEHKSWVNDAAFSKPLNATEPCDTHGLLNHCCWLCTCSDDREIKFWDIVTGDCAKTQIPRIPNNGTIKSVATSTRHLFAGSSAGLIFIFSLQKSCDREDRHECSLNAGPQLFCPQTDINHGGHMISALYVGGFNHREDYLFSGSRDGTIIVWQLPAQGLEFERLTLLDHSKGISQIVSSWSNLYTCADDETIKVWCLTDMSLQKILHPNRRVKCLWPAEYKAEEHLDDDASIASNQEEVEENIKSGSLYGGLCDGSVVIWRMGLYC